MKASTFKKMPVVSIADGTQVGTVEAVLFDARDLRVTALALGGPGGQSVLPISAIRSIGADAVTVESAAATQGAAGQSSLEGTRGLDELTSLSAVNSDGTLLGKITEVEIDQADGRLVALVAHRGGVMGFGGTSITIPAAAIRNIGPKLVTVDLPAEEGEKLPSS